MPTVHEILKQTGFTDEQIAGLDPKAITAFTGVLSTAEQERLTAAQAREAAEIAERSNRQFYDQSIAPALNNWSVEKSNYDAQLSYYKSQLESARAAGLELAEPPGPARDSSGRYVAGAPGATPGSPTFQGVDQLRNEVGTALGVLTDLQWRYQRLYSEPMPISPTQLVKEAEARRLDPVAYAEQRFNFQAREAELARKSQEEHDASVAAKATEEANRKWAEKIGSNPDVRIAQPSRYAEVSRAVKAGERPDPLTLNDSQRRAATASAIHREVAERSEVA